MRKLTFQIKENKEKKYLEFITDRTSEWTINQYCRNRSNIEMELVSDEETKETNSISREIKLG